MADVKLGRLWAVLSYIPPLFLLTLFWKKNNDLVFFHAKQATFIWFLVLIGGILLMIPIDFIEIVAMPVTVVLWLMCVYFFISGLIEAILGRENYIPLMGEFATELKLFKKIRG